MRPIRLTMKAFGCYAKETVVDFARLNGSLYLIVGRTGAGKTTIFDAISFALFGQPSGSERTADMLHSDFVPLSDDTVVTLDFEHQRRLYHVERSIHFSKNRGGDGYGDGKISATLTGPDEALEKASVVTARCTELLGLTAEQFRRIVMLAQGEFRQFLSSGSDKKNEILGRLFDNTPYLRYQTLLDSVRTRLRQERKELNEEITGVMNTVFVMPQNADPANYLPGSPRLTEALQALLESDEAALAALWEDHAKKNAAVEDLNRQEVAAKADNGLLDELDQKRARAKALEGQKAQIAFLTAERDAADKALHIVRPAANDLGKAEKALEQTRSGIRTKEALLLEQTAALDEAQKALAADAPKRTQAETLGREEAALRDALPQYDDLARRTQRLASDRKQLEEAQTRADEIGARGDELTQSLAAIREDLKTLEGCDADLALAEERHDKAKKRLETVAAPVTGIEARVKAILLDEEKLASAREELLALTAAAAASDERRHALYQAFLNGQAGVLGADMERELAETGHTVCPVCGTAFRTDSTHRFAQPAEDAPGKADVEAAEKDAKDAESRRQAKHTYVETQSGLLAQRKETAVSDVRAVSPICDSWDILSAPTFVTRQKHELEQDLQSAGRLCNAYSARVKRRDSLLKDEKEKALAQQTANQEYEAQRKKIEELQHAVSLAQGGVDELRARLPYPDRAAAQARLDGLTEQRTALQKEIEAHEQALTAAKEAVVGTEGELRSLRSLRPQQELAVEMARTVLAQKLSAAGFPDIAAAEAALAPIGDGDGEFWLKKRSEQLNDYSNEVANLGRRIGELEEQTAGKQRVDLTVLSAKLQAAREEQSAAAEAVTKQTTLTDGHRRVLQRVRGAREKLRRTDGAYARIERLATLAVGAASDVGKLSFDRYVMGAIFRDVLEQANRRLDIMTGGRFELVHVVDAARRTSVSGLEVEVLDRETGKQRASGSISGGEGFLVSLALALGLSDVVQMHAGGQRLDTLFIDEGFGTLDDGKLDNVITVLQQLTEGNRLVGVISHVDKLEESIPQKLRVVSGPEGSTIVPEFS